MDLMKEAARLASLATIFVWLGWIGIAWALIAGLLWWLDLLGQPNINFIQAFALSSNAIGGPLFLAIIVATFGHAVRLYAMSVASRS